MQTRHESELEVYRSEIKRLEKALREISKVFPSMPNSEFSALDRMTDAYMYINKIAKQALNP